jgi:hypothetical protein
MTTHSVRSSRSTFLITYPLRTIAMKTLHSHTIVQGCSMSGIVDLIMIILYHFLFFLPNNAQNQFNFIKHIVSKILHLESIKLFWIPSSFHLDHKAMNNYETNFLTTCFASLILLPFASCRLSQPCINLIILSFLWLQDVETSWRCSFYLTNWTCNNFNNNDQNLLNECFYWYFTYIFYLNLRTTFIVLPSQICTKKKLKP